VNRGRLTGLVLLWSALALALLASPLALDQTRLAGLLYFPAIMIGVLLSPRHGHVPAVGPIWIGAIVWSLVYWSGGLAGYVLLLEAMLVRAQGRRLYEGGREAAVADDASPRSHLACFGELLLELERRRRRHWLLAAIPGLSLDQPAESLARQALRQVPRHRAVGSLLVEFEQALVARNGEQGASAALTRMHAEAARRV